MVTGFLYHLRSHGIKVSATEWLSFIEALALGHSRCNLKVVYHLARALLVKKESLYDRYDSCFASYFEGIEDHFSVDDELMKWLSNPIMPRELSAEEIAELQSWDLDKLREEFEKRMREQKEAHNGGNRWVGTGGTSPFGWGGTNPAGVRIGGPGGGRTAVQVAELRRFANLRKDRVLDTRLIGAALRRLRKLTRDGGVEVLDIDKTIDKTVEQGGEIDLVFSPERRNRVKLLLLMDVGGSMDPYAEVCEQLFSAAHQANHFKAFEHYFFHNCIYDELYKDMYRYDGKSTEEILKNIDSTWTVVIVGDAWMSPFELTHQGGHIYYGNFNKKTGFAWLQELRHRCPNSIWLNPEGQNIWHAESVQIVRHVFPMFHMTLDGLSEAVDTLRGARANQPDLQFSK